MFHRSNVISPVYLNIAYFDYNLDSDSSLCMPWNFVKIIVDTCLPRDVGLVAILFMYIFHIVYGWGRQGSWSVLYFRLSLFSYKK